jgi:hypothetical protein
MLLHDERKIEARIRAAVVRQLTWMAVDGAKELTSKRK